MANSTSQSLNILLADDHSLIRTGIRYIIEDTVEDCHFTQASTLEETITYIKSQTFDIAIIDAHFPDGNSLTILKEAKNIQPDIKILIYTGIDENQQSLKYINAGANGFLSKMSDEEQIKDAILQMIKNGQYLSRITRDLLLSALDNRNLVNPLLSLTERELQIAELYANGLGNLEIANKLDIKQNTVSTIKKRMFDKLNITNVIELTEIIKNNQ